MRNKIKLTGKKVLVTILAFAVVCAISLLISSPEGRLRYTNSIGSALLFAILFFSLDRILNGVKRASVRSGKSWLWPGILGSLFALFMTLGSSLEKTGSVDFHNGRMWIVTFLLAVGAAVLLRYLWNRMPVVQTQKQEEIGTIIWLKAAGIVFLCYLPVFLAVFPGFFVYDAQDEYLQVVTRNFSTHHPLLHVLLLGGIIQLVYKLTDSYNAGIACYTLFQMLLMSGILGWCIWKLRRRGLSRRGGRLLTIYFGIFPVLVMFSLCSAKDGLFMGMLLIQVLLLRELTGEPEDFFRTPRKWLLLGAASLGMMLLRHNGFYAFVVFIPILVISLKNYRKKVLLYMISIVISYALLNSGLTMLFHADASENQEKLTVPIMQMSRIYAYEPSALSAEELQRLTTYLPTEALERYTPKVSDSVKISFDNAAYEADKMGFWRLWAQLGVRHPFAYLNAWFMTSYGFWYPDAVIDGYRGNTVFTYTYKDSSYFGYEVEEPGTRQSLFPPLNEWYRRLSLELTQQRIPVISMLFSPGFLFWVMLFILGFWCYTGRYNRLLPYLLPMLCFLTVLLGPVCLVRYVAYLWVIVPLALWDVGIENRHQL